MALVACSECGREVSERAKSCPGCGAPIAASLPEKTLRTFTPSFLGSDPGKALAYGLIGLFTCGLGWLLFVPWYIELSNTRLVVTNKRVTLVRGFASKRSSEVLLEHIRNVTVLQRPAQRMFNAADVGISSSGQSDVELVVKGLANPFAMKKLVDQHRGAA